MAKSLRIPGVVDLLLADDPDEIETLAADPRLDRRYDGAGPLINRMIVGRLRRYLQINGVRLPSVAPREAAGRAAQQADLAARLPAAPPAGIGAADLDELALHVLGKRRPEDLGPLVQQAVGRQFAPGYRASDRSWSDARLLDASIRSNNPARRLFWRLSGSVERARRRLGVQIGNDGAAVHATGIAVHNLVHSIERMRDLAAQCGASELPSAEAAIARCLSAPSSVVREAVARGATAAGGFHQGTLVLLRLEAAQQRHSRRRIAFMAEGWSRCPAHAWVIAFLTAVWERASAMRRGEPGGTERMPDHGLAGSAAR